MTGRQASSGLRNDPAGDGATVAVALWLGAMSQTWH